jgi:hypothetical protein
MITTPHPAADTRRAQRRTIVRDGKWRLGGYGKQFMNAANTGQTSDRFQK